MTGDQTDGAAGSEPRVLKVTLQNRHGLHARPAHLFVQTANAYASQLRVRRVGDEDRVDGKSIMGMMMLAAEQGVELELEATGPDADALLRALAELVAANFGEE
ncbi:MAG TPA: HPr family phosphocarrier protein [bacterium]|nr:HPr family phosphocarrier protein [bacterium]